jgi:Predicted 3'-5' exonuclease related to the exonuclease domain of PolB
MKGNIPISELPTGEDIWLTVAVVSAREIRPQQGKPFFLCFARNASGRIALKIPSELLQSGISPRVGLWGIVGQVEDFQGQQQFLVSELRPITLEKYRELQGGEPLLPRAFTIDIETIPLPGFKERTAQRLKRSLNHGRMSEEQQQRYFEDQAAEEDRAFRSGSLAATSGRVLSIAVHIGSIVGQEVEGITQSEIEHVIGIDSDGQEQPEQQTLTGFFELLSNFDTDVDQIVGHNIVGFDLPFIFQRSLVNNIDVGSLVKITDFNSRCVYDTMHRWWLGSRNRVALDDLAWVLGIESSKTDEIEGSRIFELYEAARLAEIREYNLNDVRVTRKVYERLVSGFGR